MKKLLFPLLLILISCNKCVLKTKPIAKWRSAADPALNIVCAGNSLTWGYRLADPSTQSYPAQLAAMLSADHIVNQGINGETTETMQSRIATDIYPLYDSTKKNICIVWEIGNDIYFNGTDATDAYNNFTTYCDSVAAHGFEVIVINLPYRNNYFYSGSLITPGGDDTTTYSKKVDSVNSLMASGWNGFSSGLVTVPFTSYDTTNYIFDHIHLTEVAYGKIDSLILTKL